MLMTRPATGCLLNGNVDDTCVSRLTKFTQILRRENGLVFGKKCSGDSSFPSTTVPRQVYPCMHVSQARAHERNEDVFFRFYEQSFSKVKKDNGYDGHSTSLFC